MPIKLLPASVNPLDLSHQPDASASLAPLPQSAIIARAVQATHSTAGDAFARSSSARRSEPKFIHGTPVEDSQSNDSGPSAWEYVSAWASRHLVENTVIAHYRSYATAPAIWNGRLINLYA